MISSFGIQHSLFLRSLSISAVWFCVHCVGPWSWFEAKHWCQSIGQPLGTLRNTSYSFWSFYYTRRSHWMAPLGCASSLNGNTYNNFSMQVPSAGLCQELCMENKSNELFFFGVKKNTCICTFGYSMDLDLDRRDCKFDCINDINSTNSNRNNSCEKNSAPKAYSMFLSQLIREENWATLNATCVAVYCNKTRFSTNNQLPDSKNIPLERRIVQETQHESCKTSATAKRLKKDLLVFRRQIYISHDRKNVNFSDFEKKSILLSCQLCENGGCTFKNCSEKANQIVCSNLGSFSWEQTSTQSFDEFTKEGETMKSYGIVATSFLICVILIGVFIFTIRRKQIVSKRKGPSTLNTRERGSVATSPKECLYDLADNSKLEEQTQYTQENEVMYHHLRENIPTNNENNDAYMVARYNTSDEDTVYFGGMEDPYDHHRGTDRTRQENDTYDHAPNVG